MGSIVSTGEERISQHDMGVIIAAAVVAYRPALIPVVQHWADNAASYPCGAAAEGSCDEETDDSVRILSPRARTIQADDLLIVGVVATLGDLLGRCDTDPARRQR